MKLKNEQNTSLEKLKACLGDNVEYRKVEKIGPKVGSELVSDAIMAVVISLMAILLYIWIRFEWQFALCGVIALAHDCIVLLGLYSLFHYFEFNVNAIVALLMTACYSIHDTVVVYDRIRENMAAYRNLSVAELLDKSINETLSRTVLTSFTTILSLFALCFFGGKVIFDFCFPILFGLMFGTFSSICLSAPLLLFTGLRVDGKDLEIGLTKVTE
ncbi:MAG: protein translocase subunit SecF [Holosporaceae bacterium]|nr:protein translocase subunit SecF [Holosporaceae bacterium]